MSIKGIIFDFDGVLCNSEFLHKEAFKLALNSLGYSLVQKHSHEDWWVDPDVIQYPKFMKYFGNHGGS